MYTGNHETFTRPRLNSRDRAFLQAEREAEDRVRMMRDARCTDCMRFTESPYSPLADGTRHGMCVLFGFDRKSERSYIEHCELVDDTEPVEAHCSPEGFLPTDEFESGWRA